MTLPLIKLADKKHSRRLQNRYGSLGSIGVYLEKLEALKCEDLTKWQPSDNCNNNPPIY
jgi:hypothetical protein